MTRRRRIQPRAATSGAIAWLAALLLAAPGRSAAEVPRGAAVSRWRPGDPVPSLARAYEGQFLVGAAVTSRMTGTPDSAAFLKRQFGVIVAENEMKAAALSKRLGEYDFAAADALVAWANGNGIKVRGHCLIWHQQAIPGMFDLDGARAPRDVLVGRMRAYIHAVVGHFKGKVWAWDVVNEAFAVGDAGSDRGWRRSAWYEALGPDYVSLAFQFAHEADPDALLFYNDYDTEWPWKRALIVDLVRSLQRKGIAIHGIGHQCHYGVARPDPSQLEATLQEVARLGVRNHITEMDLSLRDRVGAPPAATAELLPATDGQLQLYLAASGDAARAEQARRWAEFFRMFRRNRDNIDAVVFWGVNDEQSWLRPPDEPLLFKGFQPTPAFWAVLGEAGVGAGEP